MSGLSRRDAERLRSNELAGPPAKHANAKFAAATIAVCSRAPLVSSTRSQQRAEGERSRTGSLTADGR
eukprot:5950-Alexandrium_andersonii.AAC.1